MIYNLRKMPRHFYRISFGVWKCLVTGNAYYKRRRLIENLLNVSFPSLMWFLEEVTVP